MNPQLLIFAFVQIALASAVLFLGHYGYGWIAAVLTLLPIVAWWLNGGRGAAGLREQIPSAIIGLSVAGLISLNQPPVGSPVLPPAAQVGLAILYAAWLMLMPRYGDKQSWQLGLAAVAQFLGVATVFLATAFWHWPEIVVVAATWAISFGLAWWFLELKGERSSQILAATWGLITAEISWVLFNWQVNYTLFGGYIIIPQAAIIMAGLGYCIGSIYVIHASKRLSRRRLIEYVTIAGVLLAIVIAGTRWNGIV